MTARKTTYLGTSDTGNPDQQGRFRLRAYTGALAFAVMITATLVATAEDEGIKAKRATERHNFSDAQITEGFFKVTFGAEFHTEGRIDRIRKYDTPVRVYVDNRGKPDRGGQINQVIADIGKRVSNLEITVTQDRADANMLVTLVHDRDLTKTIRSLYGRDRARKIQNSLEPQCLSGFRKDESYRIVHSEVILVVDAGDFVFYDCAYEEMLQALGPINDDSSNPWTMFNDDIQMGFFDVYDQYLLNILYHPRIRPGMTREEVGEIIPEILPEVRTFVAKMNNLSP